MDVDGFFQEAESKWRPLDAIRDGVFACGVAQGPGSVTESIASAEGAGQRALRILSQSRLKSATVAATVRPSLCTRCERCIPACPYGARTLDPESDRILVNPVMCQGCGNCAVVCPNGAAVLHGFSKQQMLATIDAALG